MPFGSASTATSCSGVHVSQLDRLDKVQCVLADFFEQAMKDKQRKF